MYIYIDKHPEKVRKEFRDAVEKFKSEDKVYIKNKILPLLDTEHHIGYRDRFGKPLNKYSSYCSIINSKVKKA